MRESLSRLRGVGGSLAGGTPDAATDDVAAAAAVFVNPAAGVVVVVFGLEGRVWRVEVGMAGEGGAGEGSRVSSGVGRREEDRWRIWKELLSGRKRT